MMRVLLSVIFLVLLCAATEIGHYEKDVIHTSGGDLEVSFIGHGTLMLNYDGRIIHVDPYSRLADYSKLPKADIVLLTHHHRDHLDPIALRQIRTEKTIIILTEACSPRVDGGIIMHNDPGNGG